MELLLQDLEAEEMQNKTKHYLKKLTLVFGLDINFDPNVKTFTVEGVEVE